MIDARTNSRSAALSGTAEAGAIVRIYDGDRLVATTTADETGAWSATATDLSDGAHRFTTTVTDGAGNTSETSSETEITVDATAPVASPVAAVRRTDGAVIDARTNSRSATLSGTAEAGAVVKVYDGGVEIASTTADATGAWSATASNLGDGAHNFTTTVTDEAGNTSAASDARVVTVDATAPVASPVADVKRAADGTTVGTSTNAKDVTLRGTAEAGAVVKVYDGGVEIASTTADATGAWSATASNLGDGAHNFTTTVTDVAGNTSAPSTVRAVTVDSLAPVASPVAAVARDGGAAVGSVTNAKTVTLSGTAEAGAVVKVLDGTREVGTATADASGAWSVAANNLSEGAHNFTTTVTDEAGNASAPSAVRTVTVDTVAPSTPIVAKYTPDTGPVGDGVTSAKAVTLSGTAEAGATVKVLDGTKEVGTATADASGAWSVTTGVLAEGDHAFTTKATDAAGNTGGASAPLSVRIDSRPVITSNGGIKVFEGFKPVTTIKATDSQAGALSYSIAGGADASKFVIDPVTGALAFTAIPDYENPADAGRNNVYDVTVKVTDADGNSVTQDIAVTVADMRPDPVFGDDAANLFIGRPFAEAIVGYAGADTVSNELASAGVTANLATPFSNRGEAAGDLYKSIENLTGSAFNDKLVGDGAANVLDGGPGGDRLEGGGGSDTASYARAASGVTADLTKSANNSGEAAGDTYSSIENLSGSQFADRLVGNGSANVLTGRDGADTLIANAGNDKLIGGLGPDTLNGGAGRDLYAYSAPSEGGDLIQGFVVRDDQIQISASGFKGGLVAGQKLVAGETFISSTAPVASTAKGTFLYDTDAQDLFYDADGSGAGASVKIAHFDSSVALKADDFDIVA